MKKLKGLAKETEKLLKYKTTIEEISLHFQKEIEMWMKMQSN